MQEFNQASLIMKEQLDSLFDPLEKFIDFTQEWMRDNPDQSQYPNLLNCFLKPIHSLKSAAFTMKLSERNLSMITTTSCLI